MITARFLAIARSSLLFAVILFAQPAAGEFGFPGDVSLRLDDSSNRARREQYRFRFKPEFSFNEQWSVHAFVATGAAFPSAYNTFGGRDDINVRRFFGRWAAGNNKVEFGVIPPYKGRVSSTGLSDEGWIRGVRGVVAIGDDRLELVAGDLSDLRASNALSEPFDLNFFELEYSGRINEFLTYELGGERMLDENYVRTELRLTTRRDIAWSVELVHGFKSDSTKSVFSALAPFNLESGELEWFTYYAYVPREFGERAVLTEDFLSFGNALGILFEYRWSGLERIKWFAEFETGEVRDRGKIGLEIGFGG